MTWILGGDNDDTESKDAIFQSFQECTITTLISNACPMHAVCDETQNWNQIWYFLWDQIRDVLTGTICFVILILTFFETTFSCD